MTGVVLAAPSSLAQQSWNPIVRSDFLFDSKAVDMKQIPDLV